MAVRVDRWQHLVSGAFRLTAAPVRAKPDEARDYLANVLEVFGPETDPVDDWEGYAVRRMALALRDAMEALEARPAAPAADPDADT